MSIGTFTLVKNEARWMGPHLASWLPHVSQMVFFDGNSTDGTLDIIKDFQKSHPEGKKILLVEGQDPKDLKDDYVRLFNECIGRLTTDYAAFVHPDMILMRPGDFNLSSPAATMEMVSFGGEPDGLLYRIDGRGTAWKNIYFRGLGLHYFGHYGTVEEDCYFRDITGDIHSPNHHPYAVEKSGALVYHFSDVRPLSRRIDRMVKCLMNQGANEKQALEMAEQHPRVTLRSGHGFSFFAENYPPIFQTWKEALCVKS